MPAPPLSNTFEGGSNGVAITAANSGGVSGDAFSSVIGTLCTFETTTVHTGSVGMSVVNPAVSNQVAWSGLGSFTSSVYFRAYLYVPALQTTNDATVFSVESSTNARSALLSIRTAANSGTIRAYNAAAGQAAVGTHGIPVGAWFRLEMRIISSTTVGEIEWRLYNSDDVTLLEDINTTGLVLAANTDIILFGIAATTPSTPYTIYFDDLAVSTSGWVGPTASAEARPYVNVTVAA